MDKKIRVLVVDDSFLMRKILSDIIDSDPALETVGKAKDGQDALEKIYSLKPDVITLDINLPVLDGISVLEDVMQKQPTPVIMVSAYMRQGASLTIRALELGAVDFIAKPSGEVSLDIHKLREEILSKIKLAASVSLANVIVAKARPEAKLPLVEKKTGYIKKLVLIGSSTGGPRIILDIMRDIPEDIMASFLIVQHMPEGFTQSFAERIAWQSKIKAKEAQEDDIISAAKAYVAPAGYHMLLKKHHDLYTIKLNQEPEVNYVRPSADVTMSSAAEVFDRKIVGVIISGMGKDGLEGIRRIKDKGGFVIIQDQKTSVVWGMPKAVHDAGLADKVLPASEIAKAIIHAVES